MRHNVTPSTEQSRRWGDPKNHNLPKRRTFFIGFVLLHAEPFPLSRSSEHLGCLLVCPVEGQFLCSHISVVVSGLCCLARRGRFCYHPSSTDLRPVYNVKAFMIVENISLLWISQPVCRNRFHCMAQVICNQSNM